MAQSPSRLHAPSDLPGDSPGTGDEVREDPLAGLRPLPPERAHELLLRLIGRNLGGSVARAVTVAVVVAGCAAVGWWLLRPPAAPIEASLPLAGTEAPAASGPVGASVGPGLVTSTTDPSSADVVVQAAGAVADPGVYRLPAGARVDDLVREAGGLTPEADPDRVNLAAPVVDGERVWVPRRGEEAVPEVVAGSGPAAAGGGSVGTDVAVEVVDLNQASVSELDALPGVGPAIAAAIVAYREEHGRFSSVDDLVDVRGIGEAKLEQIRPLATV